MKFWRGTDRNVAIIPDVIEDRVKESNDWGKVRKSIWRGLYDLFVCFPDQDSFTKEDMEEMKNGRACYAKESQRLPGQEKMHVHHRKPKRNFTSKKLANRIANLFICSPRYHRDGGHIDDEKHFGKYRAKKVQEQRARGE